MSTASIDELRAIIQGNVRADEPMASHTTYAVGGPADIYVEPADEADLSALLKWTYERKVPWLVIGGGTNLLISDSGIRGVVIHIGKPFSRVTIEGERVIAGAAALLAKVVDAAVRVGLSGLECATGVPGSIGGAIIMNAGTHRGQVGDTVESVRVVRIDGTPETLSREELGFSYRRNALQGDASRIVTSATFRLQPRDRAELVRTVQRLKRRRRETQPNVGGSAGCMFKNPEGGRAGRMIDEAGMKGKRRGDALVSDIHANFILNMGQATAADIRRLAEEVRQTVQEKFGVALEYEVRIIGDWTDFEEA